jgi:NitT/TauT family transport system substrate-binding protein
MVNKKILGIAAIIIIIAAVASAYYVTAASANTIKQGYIPGTGDALVFIAYEKGYFKDEGLDVQLTQFSSVVDENNALASGKINVMAGGVGEPLNLIQKGKNLTVIGGVMAGDSAVIANASEVSTLQNITNFKGKTVATVKTSTGDVVWRAALKNAGVNESSINIVEYKTPGDVIQAVKSGKADAGIVWPPFEYTAQQQNLSIVKYSNDYIPNLPCCRVTLQTSTLKENPDKWVRYEEALIKAYDFYKTNPDESVDITAKYVTMNKSVLKTALYAQQLSLSPDPNKAGTLKYWSIMNQIGYANTGTTDLSQYINTTIYKTALDDVIKENPDNSNYKELATEYAANDA